MTTKELDQFFDLIVLAKQIDYYSQTEMNFFYDIYLAERQRQLEIKHFKKRP